MQLTVVVHFSQHSDTFDLVVKQTYIAHQSTTNLKRHTNLQTMKYFRKAEN